MLRDIHYACDNQHVCNVCVAIYELQNCDPYAPLVLAKEGEIVVGQFTTIYGPTPAGKLFGNVLMFALQCLLGLPFPRTRRIVYHSAGTPGR